MARNGNNGSSSRRGGNNGTTTPAATGFNPQQLAQLRSTVDQALAARGVCAYGATTYAAPVTINQPQPAPAPAPAQYQQPAPASLTPPAMPISSDPEAWRQYGMALAAYQAVLQQAAATTTVEPLQQQAYAAYAAQVAQRQAMQQQVPPAPQPVVQQSVQPAPAPAPAPTPQTIQYVVPRPAPVRTNPAPAPRPCVGGGFTGAAKAFVYRDPATGFNKITNDYFVAYQAVGKNDVIVVRAWYENGAPVRILNATELAQYAPVWDIDLPEPAPQAQPRPQSAPAAQPAPAQQPTPQQLAQEQQAAIATAIQQSLAGLDPATQAAIIASLQTGA